MLNGEPTTEEIKLCSDAFSSERMRFVADAPFYGILLINLDALGTGVECLTAAVNYKQIFLNATEPGRLVDKKGQPISNMCFHRLKPMARRTLCAHELLHVVLEHLDIPPNFDPHIANIAQDSVINRIIMGDNTFDLMAIPEGGVIPIKEYSGFTGFTIGKGKDKKEFKIQGFADMDWQPIYYKIQEKLEEEAKQQGHGGSAEALKQAVAAAAAALNGQNPMGGDVDYEPEGQTDSDFENARREMRAAVINAVDSCKSQGTVPAEIQAMVDDLRKPKIRWRDRLSRLLRTETTNDDFKYKSNPRRAHLGGVDRNGRRRPGFFPRVESDALAAIWLVIDTSGSMSDDDLNIGISEFRGMRQTTPFPLYFISNDAKAYERVYTPATEEPDWKAICTQHIHGRGGTDFRPPFMMMREWMKESGEKPALMVFFTDGYGPFPEEAPPWPVIFVVTDSGAADSAFPSWSKVIRMADQ